MQDNDIEGLVEAVIRALPPAPDRDGLGRPTKYRIEFVEEARKLFEAGATEQEVADYLEISKATLTTWKRLHPAFLAAVKDGRAIADSRVEASLYHRAVGYTHPDVYMSSYEGVVQATPIIKHYPPDATSCIFWLKNRKRKEWRDKVDVAHTDPDGRPVGSELMDRAELARRVAYGLAYPERCGVVAEQ